MYVICLSIWGYSVYGKNWAIINNIEQYWMLLTAQGPYWTGLDISGQLWTLMDVVRY